MKHKLLVLAAFFGLFLSISPRAAMAQGNDILKARIPFAFRVGNVNFPSGRYTLKPMDETDRWMEIRSDKTGRGAFFQVVATDVRKAPSKNELIFHRTGNRYSLATLLDQGSHVGDKVIRFRRG